MIDLKNNRVAQLQARICRNQAMLDDETPITLTDDERDRMEVQLEYDLDELSCFLIKTEMDRVLSR